MNMEGQEQVQQADKLEQLIQKAGALIDAEEKEIDEDLEFIEYSKKYKRVMNRIFREKVRGKFLPYPEVDNLFEQFRSRVAIKISNIKERYRRN